MDGQVGQVGRVGMVGRVGRVPLAGRVALRGLRACATGLVVATFAILAIAPAHAGGWAVITVNDLPECAVSGQALTLRFKVRQHGVHLLPGLKPSVRATSTTGLETTAPAAATENLGEYVATLTLPQPGDWAISIDSGFLSSAITLPVLTVVSPGSPFPPRLADIVRGQRLFVAKGCVTCHRHESASSARGLGVGPDLSRKPLSRDGLTQFLASPGAGDQYGQMPNLNLREDEIAALVAFIKNSQGPNSQIKLRNEDGRVQILKP